MIVDDDEAFLQVAQALLERHGVTVAGVAHSCAEAVQRAQALRPDVVLIDIRLGEESGFEAAARRLAPHKLLKGLRTVSHNVRRHGRRHTLLAVPRGLQLASRAGGCWR